VRQAEQQRGGAAAFGHASPPRCWCFACVAQDARRASLPLYAPHPRLSQHQSERIDQPQALICASAPRCSLPQSCSKLKRQRQLLAACVVTGAMCTAPDAPVSVARRGGQTKEAGRPWRSQCCAATGSCRAQLPPSAGTGGVPAPPSSHDVRRSAAILLYHLHTLLCSVVCPSAAASLPLRSFAHTSSSRYCTRARASSSAGAGLLLADCEVRCARSCICHVAAIC
jgi:hypothetical protein